MTQSEDMSSESLTEIIRKEREGRRAFEATHPEFATFIGPLLGATGLHLRKLRQFPPTNPIPEQVMYDHIYTDRCPECREHLRFDIECTLKFIRSESDYQRGLAIIASLRD